MATWSFVSSKCLGFPVNTPQAKFTTPSNTKGNYSHWKSLELREELLAYRTKLNENLLLWCTICQNFFFKKKLPLKAYLLEKLLKKELLLDYANILNRPWSFLVNRIKSDSKLNFKATRLYVHTHAWTSKLFQFEKAFTGKIIKTKSLQDMQKN